MLRPQPVPPPSPWMRRKAAAEYCGVSLRTFDAWIAEGIVPVYRPPTCRMVLIERTALDRAMATWKESAQVIGFNRDRDDD